MFQFIPQDQRKKLRNITVLLVYAIISFWLLINGSGLFPNWDSSWSYIIIIYMLGVTIFILVEETFPRSAKKNIPKAHEGSLVDNFWGFVWGFIVTIIVLIAIYDSGIYFQGLTQLAKHLILQTLIYQLLIVSTSEEIIFRGVIYRFLYQYHWMIAYVGSALIFSFFHFAVYQGNINAFITAFLMGLVLSYCVDRWNLGVTIAIHWTWNIFVLGAIITFI